MPTNDVRFLVRDDFESHEARVCIHEGVLLDDPGRALRYSDQQYLRTPADMAEEFHRRVRIGIGNYQALFRRPEYLFGTSPQRAFTYFSHKVLRWLTPQLALAALLTSGSPSARNGAAASTVRQVWAQRSSPAICSPRPE